MTEEKKRRVAIYLRVSTDNQSTDNQRKDLLKAVEWNDWELVNVYVDDGISGAKGKDARPGYKALCEAVGRREIDVIAAWSVDRLSRSLKDLISFVEELQAKKVDLYLHTQGIDTATPAGKMMFQIIGVFAEFERTMIRERIMGGLARARAEGKVMGRPQTSPEKEKCIRQALQMGMSYRKAAAAGGDVSIRVVQRIARELDIRRQRA